MIAARPVPGFTEVFGAYLRRFARASFRGIWIAGDLQLPTSGFIAVANHTSWWDGFMAFLVHRTFAPRTPFAIMMSEGELRRFPFFRWGGAFSVSSHAREARASILYAAELARDGTGVWIFPEGRFSHPCALARFTAGYVHAARRAGVCVVPFALRYVMLEAQRPDVFVRAGAPVSANAANIRTAVPQKIATMIRGIDQAISRGETPSAYRRLLAPRPGIDDIVARTLQPFVRRT